MIFLVAFVTTPAFVFATVAGMRSADPAARELLASVDAGRWEVLWRLRLPSALPSIFAAARYNVGLALAASYYGEGGNLTTSGLGRGRTAGRQPERRGPVGDDPGHGRARASCSSASSRVIERVALRWHVSQRAPGAVRPHGVTRRCRYVGDRTNRTGRPDLLARVLAGSLRSTRSPAGPVRWHTSEPSSRSTP